MMNRPAIALLGLCSSFAAAASHAGDGLGLGALPVLGTVDERFQSYNVEMVEVTGGRFWAPYGGPPEEMFRQRPPIDLADSRLRALAKHLAPAFMRVSGTWANDTYLPAEGEEPATAPAGFRQVLRPDQWRGVVEFSKAVDAPIVTSFAVTTGTRDEAGNWQPLQASRLAELTREAGGTIYAAEFFNEPNAPGAMPSMPKDYDAARYAADFRTFRDWARTSVPEMKIIGPGGVGEGSLTADLPVAMLSGGYIRSEEMLAANPDSLDGLSYHFYGSVSQRCAAMKIGTAVKEEALTPAWLDRTLTDYAFYSALRDRFEPGKPLWLTETAQAACGGSPWASTFLDSFRYLNQLGLLAQKGVQVVMHNTLAASDYALIDQDTLAPRPNYWAAVLWRKLMDRTVLGSPASPAPELRLYAHCLRGSRGGVGLLAINAGSAGQVLELGQRASVWLMTGEPVDTREVKVNGRTPSLDAKGKIRGLEATHTRGRLALPGQSIAFVAVPGADNAACR